MTLYSIPVTIDVVANSRDEAEDLVCDILDKAFIYGCGLSECTAQDRPFGIETARVFDYDIKEDDERVLG